MRKLETPTNSTSCIATTNRGTADRLVAEAHDLFARGHASLAEAARLKALEPPDTTAKSASWIPPGSVLTKRQELALARAGTLESAKVGRRVLIRRRSLEAFVEAHQRDTQNAAQVEDLFGARRTS